MSVRMMPVFDPAVGREAVGFGMLGEVGVQLVARAAVLERAAVPPALGGEDLIERGVLHGVEARQGCS